MNPRNAQRILWAVLIVALVAVGTFAFVRWMQQAPHRKLEDFGAVPAFTLTSEQGQPVSLSSLAGHIWVADLFFTRCATVCPIMTQKMHLLQTALADQPDVRLISFSADPTNDKPATLRAYAQANGADPARWGFLTGPTSTIFQISKNGFHLPIDSVGGDQNPPIVHSARFVLIDTRGHIRGYYNGAEDTARVMILADIAALKQTP